jgi:hypothetical protein
MAFVLEDRVRENSSSTGTGPFTLAGAIGGYRSFAGVMSIGDQTYYAMVLPGGAWETGVGTYTALNTLTRSVILRSSNSNAVVAFAAGTKDIFMCMPASRSPPFQAGTLMLFQQTTAPILWTKQTTHNDKALRVVSGTASSGGTNAFSSVNGATAAFVNGHQLTVTEMPSHSHGATQINGAGVLYSGGGTQGYASGTSASEAITIGFSINNTGGDGTHSHTLNMAIQYVDLIICSKDA